MTHHRGETIELLVGKVGRAHGVAGDLTVDVRTDEPDRRFAPATTFDTVSGRLMVQTSRWHGRRLLVRFAGIDDRTSAEALRGVELRIAIGADERPVDPEEFYDHQLVGLRVEADTGEQLGQVSDILHLAAQDVLVVRQGTRDVLVPFVAELVPVVDVESGRLVISDEPGLFDEVVADRSQPTSRHHDQDGA